MRPHPLPRLTPYTVFAGCQQAHLSSWPPIILLFTTHDDVRRPVWSHRNKCILFLRFYLKYVNIKDSRHWVMGTSLLMKLVVSFNVHFVPLEGLDSHMYAVVFPYSYMNFYVPRVNQRAFKNILKRFYSNYRIFSCLIAILYFNKLYSNNVPSHGRYY